MKCFNVVCVQHFLRIKESILKPDYLHPKLSSKSFSLTMSAVAIFLFILPLATSFNDLFSGFGSSAATAESIATFASSDCTTPKSDWDLGQTACAVATGTTGKRRIVWVAPDGVIADQGTPFNNGTGSDNYTFLTSGPFAQYGTWTVKTIDDSGAGFAIATFLVRNPAINNVDLLVSKFGPELATPGNDVTYRIEVTNRGPDAAANLVLNEVVPANTTFVSATQDSGPGFECTGANCTIASLPANATAIFTYVYNVSAGTSDGTVIVNTATVSSDTNELRAADNSAVYQTTVVVDASNCSVSCPDDVTVGNTATQCGAVVTYSSPSSTGSCGVVTCNPPSGTFFPLGTTRVACAGESGTSCGFNVTVENNESKQITCPSNITTGESPTGSRSAIVNYQSPTGSGCSGETITCVPASGSAFPLGSTLVHCNSSAGLSCSFSVSVTSASCSMTCTGEITVNNTTNQCGAVVTYANPAGSCGSISCSPSSGSFFPIGTTGVSCTGSAGGNCSFSVTVLDVQKPTIVCPANQTAVEDAPGSGRAAVSYTNPAATDNCPGAVTTSCNPASGSLFFVGTTTVTCVAEDGSENSANCTFTVTVTATGCSVICPGNVLRSTAPNQCGSVITYPAATTSGSTCGSVVTCLPPSGSFFPVGSTNVTCSDGAGHNCSFLVSVVDEQAPQLTCPGTTTVTENPIGSNSAVVTFTASATDNCPGLGVIVCTPPSGSTFPLGQTLVTCSVDDAAGNTGSCQFVVQVSLYNFEGFFSPVTNIPAFNIVNAGRSIPVKFSLGGNRGLNIFDAGYPVSGEISCDDSAQPVEITETVNSGGSTLAYDASTDRYTYVWKTNSAWAGTCRRLILRFNDGTEQTALFKFR